MAEKTKRKKFSVILTFGIVFLCTYFAISLFSIEKDIKDTKEQIAVVNQEKKVQDAKNAELRREIESGNIKEHAESIAMDEYGYVMPGAHIYYDISVSD